MTFRCVIDMMPPAHLCVPCKGSRLLCGLDYCPILQRLNIQNKVFADVKTEVFGPSPPNIFVGHVGYPVVAVGAMASDTPVEDDPRRMFGQPLDKIVEERSKLFRSAVKREVLAKDKYISDMQELVLSQEPVDVEIKFKYAPKPEVEFSPMTQPMGPIGQLENYRITGNAKIPKRIDSLASENIKASVAVKELLYRGYDNYYLTRVFSAGIFGENARKRLVPTRWSITAMDDMIAKIYLEAIREAPEISDYELYTSYYLSNRYVVMLIPGRWEFENYEAWAHGTTWNLSETGTFITKEHEPFEGRTKYAEQQAGGYYASRYAVVEHLFERRRQARAIVIREVEPGYMVPVGVWQVRENVRNAFKAGATKFSSLEDMLSYAKHILSNDISVYLKNDVVLSQKRITDYFKF